MNYDNIDLASITEELIVLVSRVLGVDIKKFEDYLVNYIREKPKYGDKILSLTIKHTEKSGIKEIDYILNALEEGAAGNIKNFKEIIELICKNSWEKKIPVNEYIYSDDFKKICRIPIYIPSRSNLILGLLSGEYILNLLAKADGNEIKLEWRTGLKDNKIESYHRKLIKFFSSKSSDCYKFENKLQISLENLVVKKEKQGTLLWNIFEWYGYSIYDLNGNVDSKNKVFELFDIPYLLNFGGGSVSGAENTLEMADFFNGVVLFKTMMFQNIKEHSKLQILKLYDYLSEIVAYLAMLVLLIFSFTDKFVDKREIEKKKIFFEFQNELNGEFKEKYNFYLKEFFPEVSDVGKLREYWDVTVNLICSSHFDITDNLPIKISSKSLNQDKVSICKIRTKIFFAVMFFVINSQNYEVKKIGKNTKLYERVIGIRQGSPKNANSLYNVLRKISTHYLPKNRRHFYLTLFVQYAWWSLEQFYSFTMPNEILKLVRKFISEILNRCEIIMRVNDLNGSIEEADKLKNYLNNNNPLEMFERIDVEN